MCKGWHEETWLINVTDSMFDMNRTTSVPKSVLHYELDKGSTSNTQGLA